MKVHLAGLAIADPAERWRGLGFAVDDRDRIVLAGVQLTLAGAGRGITGVSDVRPAVQRGRRVASVGRGAGLSTRLAFIDPE